VVGVVVIKGKVSPEALDELLTVRGSSGANNLQTCLLGELNGGHPHSSTNLAYRRKKRKRNR